MKWTIPLLAALSATMVAAAPAAPLKTTLDTITAPLDTRDIMRPQRHCSKMLWISFACSFPIDKNDPDRIMKFNACMGAEWDCDCALSGEGCGDPWGDPWETGQPPLLE
ncbi:hypothetical protein E4T47_03297 [Aureobasidium subglaciale]|nr:hypothetical protein E4T43_04888 [Aureobasidium subglaciale]KAI5273531.1 hypothetical protein E4T47_03297 [Aureobasidium subglaciale]